MDTETERRIGILIENWPLLIVVVPVIFVVLGWKWHLEQDYKLDHYVPVSAVVQNGFVESRRGSKSTIYSAKLTYTFSYQGVSYTADEVTPEFSTRDRETAEEIVKQFPEGGTFTAWCNPRDPSQAFIVRRYSTQGAFIIAGAAFFSLLCMFACVALYTQSRLPLATKVADGMFELRAQVTLEENWKCAVGISAFWVVATHWPVIDMFRRAQLDGVGYCALLACGVGDLGAMLAIIKFAMLRRRIESPRVFIDIPEPHCGETVHVVVKQKIFARKEIRSWVGLVCLKTTGSGRRAKIVTEYETFHALDGQPAMEGLFIDQRTELAIPAEYSPSVAAVTRARFDWKIVVRESFGKGSDYRATFPLEVRAAKLG